MKVSVMEPSKNESPRDAFAFGCFGLISSGQLPLRDGASVGSSAGRPTAQQAEVVAQP